MNKQFQAAPNFFMCPPNITDRPLWFFYACGDSTQILTPYRVRNFQIDRRRRRVKISNFQTFINVYIIENYSTARFEKQLKLRDSISSTNILVSENLENFYIQP